MAGRGSGKCSWEHHQCRLSPRSDCGADCIPCTKAGAESSEVFFPLAFEVLDPMFPVFPLKIFSGHIKYNECPKIQWLQWMQYVSTRVSQPASWSWCNMMQLSQVSQCWLAMTWASHSVVTIVAGAPTGYPWSWLRASFDLLSRWHHWWLPGTEGCDLWVYCIRRYIEPIRR